MNAPDFDVVILGGGLAGGLLARQLRLQRPDLRVLCCERATERSFKVGEATVELFSNHMLRKLALSTYLYEHQLPKNGLRFFFGRPPETAALPEMSEVGSQSLPYHPSFQLDRAALEQHLLDSSAALGAEMLTDAKVTAVHLGEPWHRVTFEHGGRSRTVTVGFVADASGRASILAKQLGLRLPTPEHQCLASWGRVTGLVDMDGPAMDPEFRARARYSPRRLSTVHFMHRGYWIWFIPLKGGVTSVGVVGDRRRLTREVLTEGGLRAFLDRHRTSRELLADASWMDFGGYGQLAYRTKQWFGDRWALVGEAGAFTDPFYSPGSDFITLANDFTCDLVARRADGEDVAERTRLYDGYLQFRYEANVPLYSGLYELFGSFELMSVKWDFDIASYYNLWVESFMKDEHLDLDVLRTELRQQQLVVRALQRFNALFVATERALTERGDYERGNLGRFTEGLAAVDFVRDVGRRSKKAIDMESMRIFAKARARCFELLGRPVGADDKLDFADFVTGKALAPTAG
jgi:flavin-dependent dehydrogenase